MVLYNENLVILKEQSKSVKTGGGLRGEVEEFSKGSRRRMKRRICDFSLGRKDCKVIHMTLPDKISSDNFKSMMKRFRDHIKRRDLCMIYKVEFTKRGVVHLHAFVWGDNADKRFWMIKKQVENAWFISALPFVVPTQLEIFKKTCVRIEAIKTSKGGVCHYITEYITKDEQNKKPEGWSSRFWGVINKKKMEDFRLFMTTIEKGRYEYSAIYNLITSNIEAPIRGLTCYLYFPLRSIYDVIEKYYVSYNGWNSGRCFDAIV